MVNKFKAAAVTLAAAAVLLTSSRAMAEEPQYRLSLLVSPSETRVHAPGYLASNGLPTDDLINRGENYLGMTGEVNFGQVNLDAFYLTGTSNSREGHPLTHERLEILNLVLGYNVIDSPVVGRMDVTLGYWRLYASPTITPPNWYDGPEIGVKGRVYFYGANALTYKLGYVPNTSENGYMKDHDVMTWRTVLNLRIGAEIPLYKTINAIAGYHYLIANNRVVVDGSDAALTFSGFYLGGMYSF